MVILISGVDGSGKGETINVLYEWMDPRYISTLAFSTPTDEERERPYMWRYWRALPPKGRIGIFAGSWYSGPDPRSHPRPRSTRAISTSAWTRSTASRRCWSTKVRWCSSSGSTCPRMASASALKALEKDPKTAWRVTKGTGTRLKTYDKLQDAAGHVLRMTNTPWAPWIVVEGTDDRYRSLTVGKIVLDALQEDVWPTSVEQTFASGAAAATEASTAWTS